MFVLCCSGLSWLNLRLCCASAGTVGQVTKVLCCEMLLCVLVLLIVPSNNCHCDILCHYWSYGDLVLALRVEEAMLRGNDVNVSMSKGGKVLQVLRCGCVKRIVGSISILHSPLKLIRRDSHGLVFSLFICKC